MAQAVYAVGTPQSFRFDLAMLVNAEEPDPPSDEKAIHRFMRAARRLKLNVSLIDVET